MVPAVHPRETLPCRRTRCWFRPRVIALSPGARTALELANCRVGYVVQRHRRGDWGILASDPSSCRENDWALDHARPVRSLFELPTGVQVILETDGDRQLTVVLLATIDEPASSSACVSMNPARRGSN